MNTAWTAHLLFQSSKNWARCRELSDLLHKKIMDRRFCPHHLTLEYAAV